MKRILLFTGFIFIFSSILMAQTAVSFDNKVKKGFVPENFKKGRSQIGLQGLSFGFGYGRIIGSVGVRYGYFIANNNLIFVSGDYSTFGTNYHNHHVIKTGFHYRRYFGNWEVKPFAQIGASVGFKEFYKEKSRFGEVNLGIGASYNVKRFSFEMGMQLNIGNSVSFAPMIGISYRF